MSHYRYRLNDGEFGEPRSITEPLIIDTVAEGQHTLEVLGRDTAGEWMPSPHTMTWIVSDEASPLLISEVMAVGSDWVEILNRSRFSVNLSGMSLTDDPDAPAKFVFPNATELGAGGRCERGVRRRIATWPELDPVAGGQLCSHPNVSRDNRRRGSIPPCRLPVGHQ